ncbi:2-hydroxychromene-2-carboxylate isomerase [Penicillium capsulatum]|uniref:2-hydroxychromene-2-carboxylate isomerase n=1 Tax=Penicillium capsulatum TaxID=69766 RepID=A0A9W9IRH2_9EURO|nr:2-hydroxychromene-2-carboxylate isomerase [Penicillium capsulatum]
MAAPRVICYFDIGSPFSYIGVHALKWIQRERLYWAHRFGVSMTEAIPEGFPASTVDLQTALSVIHKESPGSVASIAEKFFSIFWTKADTGIVNPAQFTPLAANELDGNTLSKVLNAVSRQLASIYDAHTDWPSSSPQGPDGKTLLHENTQKAFASGAFGLPWFECINCEGSAEGFWGVDHLGRVAEFLRLDTSVDSAFDVLL